MTSAESSRSPRTTRSAARSASGSIATGLPTARSSSGATSSSTVAGRLRTGPRRGTAADSPTKQAAVVAAVFDQKGAVPAAQIGPRRLAAETILECGSDRPETRRYLRPILTGEDTWCQLFSEPGSGSDLAGATTRADLHGDYWLINGQKVWTTSAHHADHGLLLARTDWDAPKHEGMSYFVIDMKQPGVDVQPLKQMNGHASFNQVFFTDAQVPAENLIGRRRGLEGGDDHARPRAPRGRRPERPRRSAERARDGFTSKSEAETANQSALQVVSAARRARRSHPDAGQGNRCERDPHVRQEIAKLMILAKSAEWTARRARAAQQRRDARRGRKARSASSRPAMWPPGRAHVHTLMTGAEAMLTGPGSPRGRDHREILVSVPAISIAGGTDEIQRNIIAERVLGMPREPRRHQQALQGRAAKHRVVVVGRRRPRSRLSPRPAG